MAAIITEEFRRNNTQMLIDDIDAVPYYLGIGQQLNWAETKDITGAPYPKGTVGDTRRATQGLTGLFRVGSTSKSLVIPKVDLLSGKSYKVYDPFDPTCFYHDTNTNLSPCYAMLGADLIFICIHKTPTATAMSANDINNNLGDGALNDYGIAQFNGYTWAYLGKYTQYSFINSNEFVAFDPLTTLSTVDANNTDTLIKEKTGGMILGFSVLNGGSGYVSSPGSGGGVNTALGVPATIYGLDENGDHIAGAALNVDVDYDADSGKILDVRLLQLNATPGNKRVGYADARIELTGWTAANDPGYSDPTDDAHIIVRLAPIEGFGYRKVDTLPAWYVGVYADTGSASYIPDSTEYHQISLIREPLKSDGVTQLTADYAQPLNYFELGTAGIGNDWSYNTQVVAGWTILQDDEKVGVLSHVQQVVSSSDVTELDPIRYYYYGDYFAGYRPIVPGGGTIKFVSPDGVSTIDTAFNVANVVISPNYKPHSGKLIFQDNRGTISRAEGQNEELKVIIQL